MGPRYDGGIGFDAASGLNLALVATGVDPPLLQNHLCNTLRVKPLC